MWLNGELSHEYYVHPTELQFLRRRRTASPLFRNINEYFKHIIMLVDKSSLDS